MKHTVLPALFAGLLTIGTFSSAANAEDSAPAQIGPMMPIEVMEEMAAQMAIAQIAPAAGTEEATDIVKAKQETVTEVEEKTESAAEASPAAEISDVVQEETKSAEATAPAKLEVQSPQAYATAQDQKNGAVFLTVMNYTDSEELLVSASSDVAEKVELHTHVLDNGTVKMQKVDNFLIPSNGGITLQPEGHHIMLLGLKRPLKTGEKFPLTLKFSTHKPVTVDVVVH